MILSAEFQFKRSVLHTQCKFSSLLGLNAVFLDSQRYKKRPSNERQMLTLYIVCWFLCLQFYRLENSKT